jgi:type IV pilus assembly protein PilW
MPQKTKGFSLVELMVAVTIGLIILVSVSAIFITSKKSYSVQDRLARLQENARFAMQYIMKDVRMAGYYGCLTDFDTGTVTSSLNPVPGVSSFVMTLPIEGLKAGTSIWYPSLNTSIPTGTNSVTSKESACPGVIGSRCTNTDAIAILMANPAETANPSQPSPYDYPHGLDITAEMADETSPVTVAATTLVKVNDIITVSDCSNADVFQVTGITSSGGNSVIEHAVSSPPPGTPGNQTGTLGHQYKPSEGKFIKFAYRRYYIGTGSSGLPALFRDGTEGQQEIVEGIENMRILYGVDKDADGIPNVYLKPDAVVSTDWKNVVSIRVGILAMTVNDKAENTDTDSAAYDVDGDGATDFTAPGDRNKRRVFLSTVMLRNKHE